MELSLLNATPLYLFVGGILLFISVMCIAFMVKAYRAGLAIGMDVKVLKKAVTSSVTFTVLPSISILLGVIALSGSLGLPLSWLRLSVIGALQYEINVADIAANNIGMDGLTLGQMNPGNFATIALVMTVGILGGSLCCLFFLKPYMKRIQGNAIQPELDGKPKKSFGSVAMVAMFIGLCSAYIGSYVGTWAVHGDYIPLFTAAVAGGAMAVFEYFTVKKKMGWLENFSVATSMLVAMAAVVLINL